MPHEVELPVRLRDPLLHPSAIQTHDWCFGDARLRRNTIEPGAPATTSGSRNCHPSREPADPRIFDGRHATLSVPSNVLVRGNAIERISTAPIAAEPGATVIPATGRVLSRA